MLFWHVPRGPICSRRAEHGGFLYFDSARGEGKFPMASEYFLVIACGVLALLYGLVTSRQGATAQAGAGPKQEISGAGQVGARAYRNRQYRAIAVVGVVVLIVLG